jgi:hypothetical protein
VGAGGRRSLLLAVARLVDGVAITSEILTCQQSIRAGARGRWATIFWYRVQQW